MAITRLGPNQDITAAKIAGQINFKNLIINGDMSIAQRGTSTSGITGNGYAIDRYRHQITSAGTWTISQSTDVPTGQGFATSLKLDCTTADASLGASDRIRMTQRIEGNTLQSLKFGTSNAESITISFWVKSNKTGTYSWSANDNSDTKLISASYTIDSANTWEKKTLTFAGTDSPSIGIDNTSFLQCSWWLGTGSTYSGGTYRSTWTTLANSDEAAGQTVNLADDTANEWYITGVQLEADTSASDFEFLPYDVNLQRCQRYYALLTGRLYLMENRDGGNKGIVFPYPQTMRTTPTISYTLSQGSLYQNNSTQYMLSLSFSSQSTNGHSDIQNTTAEAEL
jgi:hypothetical protein